MESSLNHSRNDMTIKYSAPAKIILSGEHAVVYGKPALVSAINRRLIFTVANPVTTAPKTNASSEISHIVTTVKKYLRKQAIPLRDRKFSYSIASTIPIKQRLGSSAALSVAAAAAFLQWFTGKEFSKETVNNVAYQIEKYFHKNSSGVDTSVSSFGGLVFYRKEFEFLKNISSLTIKIPKKIEDHLFIVDSGSAAESTGEMVEAVGRLYNEKPGLIEQILNDIEKVTKRMVVALIKEDINFFKQCIVDNQIFLDMLGVVSKKANELLSSLSLFGVGKVTGGGGKKDGSGFMLFYAEKKKEFEVYCKKNKIDYFKFNPTYGGLKKEI